MSLYMLSSFQNKLLKNVFRKKVKSDFINNEQNKNLSKNRLFNRFSTTKNGVVVPGFKSFDEYIEYFNENKQR